MRHDGDPLSRRSSTMPSLHRCFALILPLAAATAASAAAPEYVVEPAPARREGEGPYPQLILRNVVVIEGTGAPALGPADIVIEGNRIANVVSVGAPGGKKPNPKRPKLAPGGREIDLSGHYAMPGLVDLHGHIGGSEQGAPAEYVYKLWMGHGITTIRDPGCGNGIDFCASESKRSEKNEIAAPRIFPYVFLGMDRDAPMTKPEHAREWVKQMKSRGALGMKCFGGSPEILAAAF